MAERESLDDSPLLSITEAEQRSAALTMAECAMRMKASNEDLRLVLDRLALTRLPMEAV